MILFEKLRWKNFLSTGNQYTEINFTKHNTNLIIGANGSGKSTMLDALTFVLFGKAFRGINKPQLINSTNERDCSVEIEFKIGTINWKVNRGIKPNIFEIYRNDTLIDQNSSSTDQQKWFEQTVLKMNYKSFTQIVILGSSNFVPFMQLPAASRREVIEDLLDIKIFSFMNSIIKEKIKSIKDEINTFELKKQSLNDKVLMQENFITELENQGKNNILTNKNKICKLLDSIENYISENNKIEELVHSLNKDISELVGCTNKLKKLGTLKGKITQKISTITQEHKFFTKNTVCPTCTQNIDESFRLNKISEAETKAKELQSGYEELVQAINDEEIKEKHFLDVSKKITSLTHEISQNNIRVFEYQKQIKGLEEEIQRITNQLENRNSEHEKLEAFKNELKGTSEKLSSKKESISYYDFSYNLLKDSGVKSSIIKKYLPLINQQVNRYLQMMDFYINFTFDDEFNEIIQSPIYEDFSYSSFSEGEKQRIDLALLFTWREVAKFKNSTNTNLLIMDEVFDSSLDTYGTEEFLKIISYVIKGANIFVISHKTGLEDKFESVTRFEKRKNFSYMI